MAVDTPAKIAILGAGPIGLEAALYARFLGYEVEVIERGNVAENVDRWRHVKMFTPFSMNSTKLGREAIHAQTGNSLPDDDALLTGAELIESYLLPLSETDLLAGNIRTQTTVVSVGKQTLSKGEAIGQTDRAEEKFRIHVKDSASVESFCDADIVIDSTGTFSNPRHMGPGGIPAIGESKFQSEIEYGIPDVCQADRETYRGKHTLVIGSGFSAATTVVALHRLAAENEQTKITWLVRSATQQPITTIENDPLAERSALANAANHLAASGDIQFRSGVFIERIEKEGEQFLVSVTDGANAEQLSFDRIIANVGYCPDNSISRELQVHQCYATEGPMKLAANLVANQSADCLAQTSHGPQSLVTTEPNFYVLGGKSYGRNSNFLLSLGHTQIRDLFSLIGDRENLDLYQTIQTLS